MKISSILLEVNKLSNKAIGLYKKFGFIDISYNQETTIMKLNISISTL